MFLLDVLCILTAVGLFFVIVVDMFRRKVWWGLLGLFTVVPAYYHVLRHYTGRRKLVAPLFFLVTLIPVIHQISVAKEGPQRVQPFLAEVTGKLSINCSLAFGFTMNSDKTSYLVLCNPANLSEIKFKDVDEMLLRYRSAFVEPMVPIFREKLLASPSTAIRIGIQSPFKVFACFELFHGKLAKSWATSGEEPCAE